MSVNINLSNIRKCICGKCPSFPGKLNEIVRFTMPGLYCAAGKSRSKIERKGCICKDCLVQIENSLLGSYYCIGGRAYVEARELIDKRDKPISTIAR